MSQGIWKHISIILEADVSLSKANNADVSKGESNHGLRKLVSKGRQIFKGEQKKNALT